METVQQNGGFTLFSIKFLSIYSILYAANPALLALPAQHFKRNNFQLEIKKKEEIRKEKKKTTVLKITKTLKIFE